MKAAIKYEVNYNHSEKYPVRIMCKFFGVSRSGYYDYVKRRRLLPRNTELVGLMEMEDTLKDIQAESPPKSKIYS